MADIYQCDRCGSTTKSRSQFKREAKKWLFFSRKGYSPDSYDLCSTCERELLDWLTNKRPLWTDSDARRVNELERLLKEEREVTARWEKIARQQKDKPS